MEMRTRIPNEPTDRLAKNTDTLGTPEAKGLPVDDKITG